MSRVQERMAEREKAPPPGEGKRSAAAPPEAEVVAQPTRRRFTAAYKRRILAEAEGCSEPGDVGRLLRREGLYSSNLTRWRRAAESGALKALSKKRGPKPKESNPLEPRVQELERENARLEDELRKARLIIEVQGKVAGLLGLSPEGGKNS